MPFIFKASYDKANRTSGRSFRGPGLDEGLRVLAAIKSRDRRADPDRHPRAVAGARRPPTSPTCCRFRRSSARQTDLLVAAAKTGRIVNIKKGQFLAPDDMKHAVAKVVDAGNPRVIVTERGTSFGYHNLVVDMRAFPMMRALGVPVVFDVTHSLQLPGGGDGVTAGQAEYIEPLASAGVAAGVDGVFLEVHEEPARAKSDAQNALRLDRLEPLLRRLIAIDAIAQAAADGRGCRMADLRARAQGPARPKRPAILALVDRLDERFERAVAAAPRSAAAASSSPAWASRASSAARSPRR